MHLLEPVDLAVCEQGKHALDPGASEELSVWDMVTPLDAQDVSQGVHVECVESLLV